LQKSIKITLQITLQKLNVADNVAGSRKKRSVNVAETQRSDNVADNVAETLGNVADKSGFFEFMNV
jgi:hypothetical protein